MKNTNLVTNNATLVNATAFEQKIDKLAAAIKGNEFDLYVIVSHELNTSDEENVKNTFTRIMLENGFVNSTISRYFTDIKRLGNIAISHTTMAGYTKALKSLGIVNMGSAAVWLSREATITNAIKTVNLDNRNALLTKRNTVLIP